MAGYEGGQKPIEPAGVSRSNIALPALRHAQDSGSMVRPISSVVLFSLCEGKNEQQKEDNEPLCMLTFGHRVSACIPTLLAEGALFATNSASSVVTRSST
jgi:hypothetical protein